ncbi:MAG: DNA repair protein RecO [Polyangiaceae bacterium]|nr:DNA repair protein RecO [Polyangiaceae bacterium]
MTRGPSSEARALLLRRTDYGEADLVVAVFTEAYGQLACLARGARASRRRFAGSLEPFHELELELGPRGGGELVALRGSRLSRPRLALASDLARMEAASRLLGWVRRATPQRAPEPRVWAEVSRALDALDAGDPRGPDAAAAEAGLALVATLGWGLDLGACVGCGRPCPEARAASVDARRGGLVCRACGGGRQVIDAPRRSRLAQALQGGGGLLADDARLGAALVDQILELHAS